MSDLLDVGAKLRSTVETDSENITLAPMSEDRECLKGRKAEAVGVGHIWGQGESAMSRKLVQCHALEIIKKKQYFHKVID